MADTCSDTSLTGWPAVKSIDAKFDPAELNGLNARTLHVLPFEKVADRLKQLGVVGGEKFWLAVRGNLTRFNEALDWWRVVNTEGTFSSDDPALIRESIAHLPAEPWSEETWPVWTKAVGTVTGTKGRALFHPLREALTGRGDGPELKKLLPLIGRERMLARLAGQTA